MRKKLEDKGRPVDRIRSLADWMIEHKVLKSHCAFEKVCGLSTYYLRNLSATEKGNPGVDTICKIYTTFPHINLHWLVLGEGDMFTVSDEEAISKALAATMDYIKEMKIKKILVSKLLKGLTKQEKLELFDRLM